jgi:hypothetical protein
MMDWHVALGRLVPYWLTVAAYSWTLAFLYAWTNDPGYIAFEGMASLVSKFIMHLAVKFHVGCLAAI